MPEGWARLIKSASAHPSAVFLILVFLYMKSTNQIYNETHGMFVNQKDDETQYIVVNQNTTETQGYSVNQKHDETHVPFVNQTKYETQD